MHAMPCLFLCILCFCAQVKGGKHTNSIWQLHQQTAKQLNTTDCWICSHIPASYKGIPLIGVPISMNDLNLTDYSYDVQIDVEHTSHNAVSDQGIYLEITGIISPPTICLGPMYVNHIAKIKGRFVSLPQIYVGETDCRNATLIFNMEFRKTSCDIMNTNCNSLCFCPTMKVSCAPRCACPEKKDKDKWNCETKLYDNMIWFQEWLGHHGRMIPKVLKQGLYYICGNRAYSWLPMGAWGNCTIGRVVPAIRQRTNISLTDAPETLLGMTRNKRELFTSADKAWMWFPSWTGWGIELANKLNKYANIMDGIINETTSSIHALNEELAQVRKVALQNRMALDYLLAIEGGTCAVIGEECCTWVEDSHDPIEAHMNKVKELQQKARDIAKEGWNPFSWMGSIGVWFNNMISDLLKPIVVVIGLVLVLLIAWKLLMLCISHCSRGNSLP
ncbi:endogenous retroviral envelope protein HEMO-like [Bufo bufo]|uniref:endogenous retroviral envelope protein HEMO-like n=1 Tax=Bufo bufo TaxID=8384 RepID=UPI001ABEB429|nr:endogenous retroviral envelope protein HEMO-like [Bufo bufo]